MSDKSIYSEVIDIENASELQKKRKYELKLTIASMLTTTSISGTLAVEALALSSNDTQNYNDILNKEFYIYQMEHKVNGAWQKGKVIEINLERESLPLSNDNVRYVLIGKKEKGQTSPAILTYQRQRLSNGIWQESDIIDIDISRMPLPKDSDDVRYVLITSDHPARSR